MNEDTKINKMPAVDLINESIAVQSDAVWLQANGQVTPDHYLKTLTPTWSPEVWERYISWFESQTARRAESLVPPRRFNKICEILEESIFVNAQSSADKDLRSLISTYLGRLTRKQLRVIEMIFWEGRSERYTAKALSMDPASVHRIKNRALSKIKDLLRKDSGSRIMKGEISSIRETKADEMVTFDRVLVVF